MLVPIGEMRETVIILAPVRTVDDAGGEVINYTESDPTFMSVRALGTTEAVQFGQVNADINHIGYGHWHDLNALTAKHRLRVVESSQLFDIAGSPVNDPKRGWTRLHLVARENE